MQHKQIIKDLVAGKFGKPTATSAPGSEDEKPVSETPGDKSLDNIILDYLASEGEGK